MSGLTLDGHSLAVAALVVVFVWCCFAATVWLRDQLSAAFPKDDDQ